MKKYYILRETASPSEIIDAIKLGKYNRSTGLRSERTLCLIEYKSHGQTIFHFTEDEFESVDSFLSRIKHCTITDDDGIEYSFTEIENKIRCYEDTKRKQYKTA